ncbi:endoglucanase C [Fusarium subglutinans]|uniref:Endoglucanase C n=1 Tax=Gibberella subglutinans TaxID=42677 RepID=A0A8H5LAS1_GIBSU|nr:endoglucanase C [Fusarium subglutinans]KAF5587807.1 endoglucanase C [Fusarium subglutinans]
MESLLLWSVLSRDMSSHTTLHPDPPQPSPSYSPGCTSLADIADLDTQGVKALLDNFFDHVHCKNPILEEAAARKVVLNVVIDGIDWSPGSCLTLIICALGKIATPLDASFHLRADSMPFLEAQALFQAAQKRIGTLMARSDIIGAQCFFLSGVFLMNLARPELSEAQQEAVYWSAWKSERELRGELSLPDFSMPYSSSVLYPPFFPTPPHPLESTRTTASSRQHTAWLFYLSEISLRRLSSRTCNDILELHRASASNVDFLKQLSLLIPAYETQANEWAESLPPELSIALAPIDDNVCCFVLCGHLVNFFERLYWPFVMAHLAALERGVTTPIPGRQFVEKGLEYYILNVEEGSRIVDPSGNTVILKGAAIGGMLNMENFITGYAGHEHQHRQQMVEVMGEEKADFFFDRLLYHFFTDSDAAYFALLGLNCIRIPFNYRHFIDDMDPDNLKKSGFDWLDRCVDICGRHNLYAVLDLHAVPGRQNQDWHSDSGLSRAAFWDFKDHQDRAIQLWKALATHYKGNTVIAGYNLLNEPADETKTSSGHHGAKLVKWYERAEKEVRAIDPDHMIFIDGNTYAMDFRAFPENPLPNAVYACHDYSFYGFPLGEQYEGTDEQNTKLRKSFERKVQFMREKNVPIWNGEFGPVYQNEHMEGDEAIKTNAKRFNLLQEQLAIYRETDVNWSIWLYKDVGYQGMVYADPESPYMRLIAPFIAKKQRLGLDFWGVVNKDGVKHLYEPFIQGLKEEVLEKYRDTKYPKIWTFERQFERVIRECLMSEYVGWELAELFRDKSKEEL